jgi:hypothetical protein
MKGLGEVVSACHDITTANYERSDGNFPFVSRLVGLLKGLSHKICIVQHG